MHKRLFVGCEVQSPWPDKWPQGRVTEAESRHLTLLFLGEQEIEKIEEMIKNIPLPSFVLGPMGYFSEVLFFPPFIPRVVAWKMQFWDRANLLACYQNNLREYFGKMLNIEMFNKKEYLPHLTVCRHPKERRKWRKHFRPLPFFLNKINLYESFGSGRYTSLWSYPFIFPFQQIEHTGDIAYKVRGEDLSQIELAARMALAFEYPTTLDFFEPIEKSESLDQVIRNLNGLLAKMDTAIGSPFKAISYHGEVKEIAEKNLLEWEMIVDV